MTDSKEIYGLKQEYYRSLLKEIKCAAYLLENNSEFPVLDANEPFYSLLECDRQDFNFRYGNKLAAFMAVDALLDAVSSGMFGEPVIHSFQCKDQSKSLMTYVQPLPGSEGALLCFSVEATELAESKAFMDRMTTLLEFFMDRIHVDVFEWNRDSSQVDLTAAPMMKRSLGTATDIDTLKEYLKAYFSEEANIAKMEDAFLNISKDCKEYVCELRLKDRNGKTQWNRFSLSCRDHVQAGRSYVVGILENITQEKEVTLKYLSETQFYHMLMTEKDGYGHIDVEEDKLMSVGGIWNLYHELVDQITYSELIETYINKVVHPEDRKHYLEVMRKNNLVESYERGITKLDCDFRRIVEQNKMVWMRLGIHLFREPLSGHLLALLYINNVDAEKKQSLDTQSEGERDSLNNIYSKNVAESMIREFLQRCRAEAVSAFLLLEIGNLKNIVETDGHNAGEKAVGDVIAALRDTFRCNDVIGRYGTDTFTILLKNVKSESLIARRLQMLADYIEERGTLLLTFRAGITMAGSGKDYGEVLEQAKSALHRAKEKEDIWFTFYGGSDGFARQQCDSRGETDDPFMLTAEEVSELSSNRFLDELVGEHGDMAYLVNPHNYELICGNKAFYDRIGITEAQCKGMKCYEAMYKWNSPCPFCTKANWSRDKFFLWKDYNGHLEQEFLIKNKLINMMGTEVLMAIAIDISNDKNIADSIENGTSESKILLGTVQQMEKCEAMEDVMQSVLDSIGHYYRADSVEFWRLREDADTYECQYSWQKRHVHKQISEKDKKVVTGWLRGRSWEGTIAFDSPEAMLGESFNMYQMMLSDGAKNQQWVQLSEWGHEYGCIVVENCGANIRNHSFLETISDFIVSRIKKMDLVDEINRSNFQDKLTDLLNRQSYEAYLQDYDPDQLVMLAVAVMNIDNLKGINTSRGYLTGNYYIKRFADLIKDAFSECHVFRLNGDEFLVIAENMERTEFEVRIDQLNMILARQEDFTVSIGQSWDNVEKDLQELITAANTAMHINKKTHYDSGTVKGTVERGRLLTKLVSEIKEGRYEIFLQPKVDMSTERLIGAEALIRYRDEKRGYIPPFEFVPMLEANNLIRYVDLFVLEEVCRLQERWIREKDFNIRISLNFSRVTLFEENILENIEKTLSRYNIFRNNIEIEITESFVAGSKSALYRVARDIYNAGCHLSLDDFGIKYTNISMLTDIDFHTLKLDKSLIKAVENREENQIVLRNIVRLCDDLGIHVIAEGVETKEQQTILKELGCTWGQGYLFGKPMTVSDFEKKYLQ